MCASRATKKEPTQPTTPTVKRLFAVSGNACPFPGCQSPLVDEASGTLIGVVCHIKGHRPGKENRAESARYDPNQTPTERHAFNNLIILCSNHHKVIDTDVVSWPVERLQKLKAEHEEGFKRRPKPNEEIASKFVLQLISERLVAAFNNDRNPLWEQSLIMLNHINETKGPIIAEQSDLMAVQEIDALLERGIQVVGRMLQRRGYY